MGNFLVSTGIEKGPRGEFCIYATGYYGQDPVSQVFIVGDGDLHTAEIQRIMVLPEHRGQGFGKITLEKAEFRAKGIGVDTLTTWMADPPILRPFLEKQGYIFDGDDATKKLT